MPEFTPSIHIVEARGRVRIWLGDIASAEGPTLQDAGDELVRKLLVTAMTIRSDSIRAANSELRVDPKRLAYLWQLGQIAAAGGDIRELLFSPNHDVSDHG